MKTNGKNAASADAALQMLVETNEVASIPVDTLLLGGLGGTADDLSLVFSLIADRKHADTAEERAIERTPGYRGSRRMVGGEDTDKEEEDKRRERWLSRMSASYRQSYEELNKNLDEADKRYDQMLAVLHRRRQELNEKLDDSRQHAILMPNGQRAYKDGQGNFVHEDGSRLQGTDENYARQVSDSRHGDVSRIEEREQRERQYAATGNLLDQINADKDKNNSIRSQAGTGQLTEKQIKNDNAQVKSDLSSVEAEYADIENESSPSSSNVKLANSDRTSSVANAASDPGTEQKSVIPTFSKVAQLQISQNTFDQPSNSPTSVPVMPTQQILTNSR